MRYIKLAGNYYEIGFQQGSMLKSEIRAVFDRYCGFDVDKISKDRIKILEKTTRDFFPEIIDELKGIADGSGMSFEEIFLRNVFVNLWLGNISDKCTCVAFIDKENGIILGKNNDVEIHEGDPMVIKEIILPTGVRVFLYSHIGTVWGGDGMNSAGLCMGLTSVGSKYKMGMAGLPVLFFLYESLKKCKSVSDVKERLRGKETLGKGYNLLIADSDGSLSVFELACPEMRVRKSENNYIFCTNTYKHPDLIDKDARAPVQKSNAEGRYRTLSNLLTGTRCYNIDMMNNILRNHDETGPICQHYRDGLQTIGSYIVIPKKGKFFAMSGHPCTGEYREYYYDR